MHQGWVYYVNFCVNVFRNANKHTAPVPGALISVKEMEGVADSSPEEWTSASQGVVSSRKLKTANIMELWVAKFKAENMLWW